MPLSHEEQRVLDEMERLLLADDPRFAERIGRPRRRLRGGMLVSVLAFCCGLAMLAVGLVGASPVHIALALTGIVVMSASCFAIMLIQERRWFGHIHPRHPR